MTFWQFAFKNVTRNSRAYFAYFVSSSFSIAVFFSFAVYLFHPKLQNFSMISEISGLMIFFRSYHCLVLVLLSTLFNRIVFKSSEKAIWCVNRFRYIKKSNYIDSFSLKIC